MTNQATVGELSFTRVFDAPRQLVFRCMISPEHLTHFWGPAGTSAPVEHIRVDPRPGKQYDAASGSAPGPAGQPQQRLVQRVDLGVGVVERQRRPHRRLV